MLNTAKEKSLLIVEDDDTLRERLVRAMERRGFNVRKASSVEEGLTAAKTSQPDYAIVDLRLQDGSGLTLVKFLEERFPKLRAIILTGYGDIPSAVAAVRAGAIDYLTKPASADEIVDALMAPEGEQPPAPDNPTSPEEARQEHIEHVLHETGDNISQAARLLNMHRRTLQRVLKRYGTVSNATN